MGSKPDPVLAVLNYFETADLALAQQAMVLVRAILRKRASVRTPKPTPKPKVNAKDQHPVTN